MSKSKNPMTIDEIIDKINSLNKKIDVDKHYVNYLPVKLVKTINDDNEEVTGFDTIASWRGSYDEPCLIQGDKHSSRDLLKELHFIQQGYEFTGYKGGRFKYMGYDYLNIESSESAYTGDGYVYAVEFDVIEQAILIYCDKS